VIYAGFFVGTIPTAICNILPVVVFVNLLPGYFIFN
jgi:hypothetical protein